MTDDRADDRAFVARVPCACGFPIGLRATDAPGARVLCPVCGAHATVNRVDSASDGPFRTVETLALVPCAPPSPAPRAGEPAFTLTGHSRGRDLASTLFALYGVPVVVGALIGVSLAIAGVTLALGFALVSSRRSETGRVRDGVLTNFHETPWSRTDRIRLAGASVDVVAGNTTDHFHVVVAQPDARLVIGETRPLTRDEADYIAERLRALT